MIQDEEKLSEEEIKEILATVDLDANGKVEYEGKLAPVNLEVVWIPN